MRLRAVLKRCKEINLTLNKKKMSNQSIRNSVHVILNTGVKPDPTKIAILKMPPPTDKKGVERLLGIVNYLAKFVSNMSAINEPIIVFLKRNVLFKWEKPQQGAFESVKNILSHEPIITFFNVEKSVCVSVDAAKCGLGAVITQNERPIACASRSLTEIERRYSQVKKELLTVTFCLEIFDQYTYGVNVTVENDNHWKYSKKKTLVETPPRLQRLLLRLQKNGFNYKYVPGKQLIIADRHLSLIYLQIPGIPIYRDVLQDIKK